MDGVRAVTADDGVATGRTGYGDTGRQKMGVHRLEVGGGGRIGERLIRRGREIDGRSHLQQESVGSRSAVDRAFGSTIGDGVVAGSRGDRVGATGTVDRVGSCAADQVVGTVGAGQRDALGRRQCGGIDVLEVRDAGQITGGLIGVAQIDVDGSLKDQLVDAGSAVDRGFGASIRDDVVAGTGADGIGSPSAVDRIGAAAADDRVRSDTAGDRHRGIHHRCVDALEVDHRDGIADRLIDTATGTEIDRGDAACRRQDEKVGTGSAGQGGFRAVIGDRVVAGATGDDVETAVAVDRVVAATTL